MERPILVTGGTGTLGRVVVRRLLDIGREVRVLSRRPQPPSEQSCSWITGDLRDAEGLDRAVSGVESIVHCATTLRSKDVPATENLIRAASRAGEPHLVFISIVGVDQIPLSYYRTKLRTEELIAESGLPWSTLRATQFHDLLLRVFSLLDRLPIVVVPAGTSFQPIDTREVAGRLVELATRPPSGRVDDLGGPQVLSAQDLARAYLRASGRRRIVWPLRLPGATFRGYRAGGHLAPNHAAGGATFDEFLSKQ